MSARGRVASLMDERLGALVAHDGYAAYRALGAGLAALGRGPIRRHSRLYSLLGRLGVLCPEVRRAPESPRLASMPWGAGRYPAGPPVDRPVALGGPWPQAPVVDPDFYPPVLSTTGADRLEHVRVNITRYIGQITGRSLGAALRSLTGPRVLPLTDARFVALLTQTSFGQFVRLGLCPDERRWFAPLLQPGRSYACADFSLSTPEHALAGIHVAPTTVLLSRGRGDDYRAHAIRVGDRIVEPDEGAAWALARYFVSQGAGLRIVLCDHPRLHFPADSVNAVTRTFLPRGHPIRALLAPHSALTLGLNEAVIHHRRSVLHNSQREIYTPFPTTAEGTHAQVVGGHRGVPGLGSYRPYRFGDGLFGDHVPYGRYRRAWFECMMRFVDDATAGLDLRDRLIERWADHVHRWVPGFPSGREIGRPGRLAWALASHICGVSVYHTGDHHSYAAIPIEQVPMRLRVPPPHVAEPPATLDLRVLVSPEDHFRHQLCHAMFFAPVIHRPLTAVRYRLGARGQAAHRRLRADMRALDEAWTSSTFPPAARIACSIQY